MKLPVVAAAFIGAALLVLAAPAAEPPVFKLWPGTPPGDRGGLPPEGDTTKDTDNLVAGRRLIRLGHVSEPSVTFFRAPAERANGATVLVCPGGGYHILAWDLEGTEVCEWLNSLGVHAALLKYRVPRRPDRPNHAAALEDAQRALGLLRQRAPELGVATNRLGVLGFSAGGNLAAFLSNTPQRTYPHVDAADDLPCRPDFAVLVYPAYLTDKDQDDRVRPELPLSTNTPPTFIAITQDDPVRVETALGYAWGLHREKVPFELHVYPRGGHGYGLRRTDNPATWWADRAGEWMKFSGWTKP
ncbi:MAG TPA: alpha/beta hydrolase [Verrucomicrobiota bacterium]|nr:alpha/beta hydrolase [Verrucomicrobiota bacterium]